MLNKHKKMITSFAKCEFYIKSSIEDFVNRIQDYTNRLGLSVKVNVHKHDTDHVLFSIDTPESVYMMFVHLNDDDVKILKSDVIITGTINTKRID